ncbi:hypothetical protein GMD78_03775 [Ornithinibacillus sp. L9]|uniref:Uncharacterized protein n=1 Tax=Ornithinibacillus caprae TaxID=2678566 RepID=A0A6N8FID4_9BACI|nr:hypothetical protein [Ornithinibacillus caprae]MUK87519.1 hypothetical protein [Ornithinibacillus caprae]
MNRIVRKLLILLISIIILFLATEWIVKGVLYLLFQSHTYITFVAPILHFTKYFAIAIVLLLLFKKYVRLTPVGRKLIPIFLVLSIVMILITSLWFQAANEEKIVRNRIVWHDVKSWDEVEYVETEIYHEEKIFTERDNPFESSSVIANYNIHFQDGSVINVWSDVSSIYELHQFVLENDIEVKHLTDTEHFNQNFSYYFKESLPKAQYIFGVE